MNKGSNKRLLVLAVFAAMAFSPAVAEEQADRKAASEVEEQSRERAADANRKAVDEAAAALLEATRLELDIQIIGRTSPTVARTAGSDQHNAQAEIRRRR